MCLFKKQNTRVRTKSIEVWKVVKVREGVIMSPFRNCPLPSTSDLIIEDDSIDVGLHAFLDKEAAHNLKLTFLGEREFPTFWGDNYDVRPTDNFRVIRGVVPKGSKYYVGFFGFHKDAIAATAINWEIPNDLKK